MSDQQERLPFDVEALSVLEAGVKEALRRVPELRSVAVVVDWNGDLNQGAGTCLWIGRNGPVQPQELEAMTGSMAQTHKLLLLQLAVLRSACEGLVEKSEATAALPRRQPQ